MLEHEEALLETMCDIFVIDPGNDAQKAFDFIHRIRSNSKLEQLHIITLFKELDATLIHFYLHEDIDNFMVQPISAEDLLHAIQLEFSAVKEANYALGDREAAVGSYLSALGIPNHLRGYHYLRTCVLLMYQGSSMKITNLYRETARRHNTTHTRVEKCIRNAIKHAYDEHPALISFVKNRNVKPTSSQVIMHVCEKLKMHAI